VPGGERAERGSDPADEFVDLVGGIIYARVQTSHHFDMAVPAMKGMFRHLQNAPPLLNASKTPVGGIIECTQFQADTVEIMSDLIERFNR
jgi:hypothetical protein